MAVSEDAAERFRREVEEWAERTAIGPARLTEGLLETVRDQYRDALRRQLRARAVPEERVELLLVEVEAVVAEDPRAIEMEVPAEVLELMERPPVRYDPGLPPV